MSGWYRHLGRRIRVLDFNLCLSTLLIRRSGLSQCGMPHFRWCRRRGTLPPFMDEQLFYRSSSSVLFYRSIPRAGITSCSDRKFVTRVTDIYRGVQSNLRSDSYLSSFVRRRDRPKAVARLLLCIETGDKRGGTRADHAHIGRIGHDPFCKRYHVCLATCLRIRITLFAMWTMFNGW